MAILLVGPSLEGLETEIGLESFRHRDVPLRDDGQWKIDDISGASDGEAWSIRHMLVGSLKS